MSRRRLLRVSLLSLLFLAGLFVLWVVVLRQGGSDEIISVSASQQPQTGAIEVVFVRRRANGTVESADGQVRVIIRQDGNELFNSETPIHASDFTLFTTGDTSYPAWTTSIAPSLLSDQLHPGVVTVSVELRPNTGGSLSDTVFITYK